MLLVYQLMSPCMTADSSDWNCFLKEKHIFFPFHLRTVLSTLLREEAWGVCEYVVCVNMWCERLCR
jgi:hypothetical protein